MLHFGLDVYVLHEQRFSGLHLQLGRCYSTPALIWSMWMHAFVCMWEIVLNFLIIKTIYVNDKCATLMRPENSDCPIRLNRVSLILFTSVCIYVHVFHVHFASEMEMLSSLELPSHTEPTISNPLWWAVESQTIFSMHVNAFGWRKKIVHQI